MLTSAQAAHAIDQPIRQNPTLAFVTRAGERYRVRLVNLEELGGVVGATALL